MLQGFRYFNTSEFSDKVDAYEYRRNILVMVQFYNPNHLHLHCIYDSANVNVKNDIYSQNSNKFKIYQK